MARPSKFSPARAHSAVLLAKAGEPRQWIARGVGVGRRTLQEWIARGRAGEEPFAAWVKEMEAADRFAHRLRMDRHWERYDAAAKERWKKFKASREGWWLARLGPERFWERRWAWLVSKGHHAAAAEALARYAEARFRTNATP